MSRFVAVEGEGDDYPQHYENRAGHRNVTNVSHSVKALDMFLKKLITH